MARIDMDQQESELKKVCSSLEGTVDLYWVMDGAKMIEDYFRDIMPKNLEFNEIRFTPQITHSGIERKQKIEGQGNTSRQALITDISWWKGNSLTEILSYLLVKGYEREKIFVYYFAKGHPEISDENKKYKGALGGKACEVLNFIQEANKKLANRGK